MKAKAQTCGTFSTFVYMVMALSWSVLFHGFHMVHGVLSKSSLSAASDGLH